jgi:hypothetical protein
MKLGSALKTVDQTISNLRSGKLGGKCQLLKIIYDVQR